MKALSLRQPWAHAVIFGGKRIENRVAWKNSNFRGAFLIHAAQGMTWREYADALKFATDRGIPYGEWPRPNRVDLERGCIVGIARVIGRVTNVGGFGQVLMHPFCACPTIDEPDPCDDWKAGGVCKYAHRRMLTTDEKRWWMGGFALVLDGVRPTPTVPCTGHLGFFEVPDDVARKAMA